MIDCPVDGRKNVTSSICPQCKTDLSPLIYIQELPEKIFMEGSRYLADKKNDEAIKEFIKALGIEPNNVKFLLALGNAYLLKGMIQDALLCSSNALTIEPGNVDALSLEKDCNTILEKRLLIEQKESSKNKLLRILLIILPVFTLLIGLSIIPIIEKLNVRNPDPQKIVNEVRTVFAKDNNLSALHLKLEYIRNSYVLSGVVPSELHKDIAEIIMVNYLQRDPLTKNEKIRNSIIIQPAQLFVSYKIRHNDNLAKIAKFFLGNSQNWLILMQYNKDRIEGPNKLKIGEIIRIPVAPNK